MEKAFVIDRDSFTYYYSLAMFEIQLKEYNRALECFDKCYTLEPENMLILTMKAFIHGLNYEFRESLQCFEEYLGLEKEYNKYESIFLHRIGYAYWKNGYSDTAMYYFRQQIEYCNKVNELLLERERMGETYYNLAGTYAFLGEREKGYQNLQLFLESPAGGKLWHLNLIKETDPLFGSIRDEPEFQQIVLDMEAKYQAEHERISRWLEENVVVF